MPGDQININIHSFVDKKTYYVLDNNDETCNMKSGMKRWQQYKCTNQLQKMKLAHTNTMANFGYSCFTQYTFLCSIYEVLHVFCSEAFLYRNFHWL